ncbi:hypothetical protein FDH29_gp48 [Aquamicrobium phage P14]|uniref:Uncharacterized protein n=1 Tax=Aquamicrobium phage P14 TaxID=1927013 RepID=A0A1L5C070_9CAUD|nr:hypothetical protein FDH29_gp48 [Aquamicrobium phage P14]APL99506.1 hypothetical protein BB738_0480 [Aquamicrobium phage P14]
MRETDLPNPGTYGKGQKLRREVALAISAAELVAARTPDGNPEIANKLKAFLTAAADACPGTLTPPEEGGGEEGGGGEGEGGDPEA